MVDLEKQTKNVRYVLPNLSFISSCSFSWVYSYLRDFYHNKNFKLPNLPENLQPEINSKILLELYDQALTDKKSKNQPKLEDENIMFQVIMQMVKKELIKAFLAMFVQYIMVFITSCFIFATVIEYSTVIPPFSIGETDSNLNQTVISQSWTEINGTEHVNSIYSLREGSPWCETK